MGIIGCCIATLVASWYMMGRSRKFKIMFIVVSAVLFIAVILLFGYFGIFDEWYVQLFVPPSVVFISAFISLFFSPYNPYEIEKYEKIKDYHSAYGDDAYISELEKLNISEKEFEHNIKLLKNVLYAFSSSKQTPYYMFGRLMPIYGFMARTPDCSDFGVLRHIIDETFDEVMKDNTYLKNSLKRYPRTKEIVFNLSVPIIVYVIKEETNNL